MGCQVIATDIPGVKDNFDELVELVKPHDVFGLAKSIDGVLSGECVVSCEEVDLRKMFDVGRVFSKYQLIYQRVDWNKL